MSGYTKLIENAIKQLEAYKVKPAGFFEDESLKDVRKEIAAEIADRLSAFIKEDLIATDLIATDRTTVTDSIVIDHSEKATVQDLNEFLEKKLSFVSNARNEKNATLFFKAGKGELETTLENLIQGIRAHQSPIQRSSDEQADPCNNVYSF
ncbi:MAG: hypothetical protein K0S08_1524 [Gammaproteobacteria bacterium]|nr:hypothetical protein [Gammaproteobacteria bacterium]